MIDRQGILNISTIELEELMSTAREPEPAHQRDLGPAILVGALVVAAILAIGAGASPP